MGITHFSSHDENHERMIFLFMHGNENDLLVLTNSNIIAKAYFNMIYLFIGFTFLSP